MRFFPDDLFTRTAPRHAAKAVGGWDDESLSHVDVRRDRSLRAGISLSHRSELGGGIGLETAMFAGVGQSRYRLPDGLAIFVDPMEVTLTSATIAPEVRLVRQVHGGRFRVGLMAGGGVEASYTRTTLRSALFHMADRYSGLAPYATLGVTVASERPRWTLALDARSIPDANGWQMRGELRLPLSGN